MMAAQPAAPSQPVAPQAPPEPIVTGSQLQKTSSKRKRNIILLIIFLLLALVGGAAAYVWYVYIPNKPEVVLRKAVESYINDKTGYTITGKLDRSGPNDPDFDYSIKTNAQGGATSNLYMSTFLQSPHIETIKADDKLYVNFGGFEDFKTLAKHYTNVGAPGIQEAVAAFTESSGLVGNQNKWLQVDDFILEQPAAPKNSGERLPGIPGAALKTIGAEETLNGKKTRKYEVTLDKDAFKLLVTHVDMNAGVPLLSGIMAGETVSVNEVKLDVWVNLSTKKIEQVTYSGRPFQNATFDIKIAASDGNSAQAPAAQLLSSALNYGIVNSIIFNPVLQQGDSDSDKQRIADLKGIKTALEIYKAKKGFYPERYEMSVNQEGFIKSQMPGADLEVFKDPRSNLIGRNGSQYAYVPALKDDSQNCGKFAKPCEKFFINTTLNDGQQYQLNSY